MIYHGKRFANEKVYVNGDRRVFELWQGEDFEVP